MYLGTANFSNKYCW